MSSLHQLQNHIVWKSSKEDARIISRMHRLSTEEFTRMGMYNLGGEHGWLAPIRGPKKTGSGGQLLALTMHKWGTTSQGSQSPLAKQLLRSHVHKYVAVFACTHICFPDFVARICTQDAMLMHIWRLCLLWQSQKSKEHGEEKEVERGKHAPGAPTQTDLFLLSTFWKSKGLQLSQG